MAEREEIFVEGEVEEEEEEEEIEGGDAEEVPSVPDHREDEEGDGGFPWLKEVAFAILMMGGLAVLLWVIYVLVTDHLTIGRLEEQMVEQTDRVESLTISVSDLSASVRNLGAIASAHEGALSSFRGETASLRGSTAEAMEKAIAAGKTGASVDKIARSVRKDLAAHSAADSARWVRADSLREVIAERQFRADSAIMVSRANLAAVERKADGALIRADSLEAARARHEAALADLAARMSGKKKK